MEKFKYLSKNKISQLPENPGVYAFIKDNEILYIGKAANIRERVKNHFQPIRPDSGQATFRDSLFIDKVTRVGYIKTDSEIEALILEANLIKKYQPKYNVVWRDDKNYFFVGITREDFPKAFITHQPKSLNPKSKILNSKFIGPFVDGRALKQTLKILQRVFPWRACHKDQKRPCVWYQLGRCCGSCLLKSETAKQVPFFYSQIKRDCQNNTRNVLKIFRGKKNQVLKNLKREMERVSILQDYEKAAKLRDKISALEKTFAHAKIFETLAATKEAEWPKTQKVLQKILKMKEEISKIEAYDISNIQGKEATGSMVTFIKGLPDKNYYRKFKIKIQGKPNDVAMIREILSRRFKHPEWSYPELILIDGGIAQLNAAIEIRNKRRKTRNIPVIALAKKENKLYVENRAKPILVKNLPREIFNLILQLRDEAHRFAISYHKKLRTYSLFS